MTAAPEASASRVLQSVDVETKMPGVAMTDAHYARIKKRIRREVEGTLTTSIWVSIALASLTLAGSLLITLNSAELSDTAAAKFEVGWLACLGFGLFCFFVHFKTREPATARADDLIDEIETNLFHVPQSQGGANPVIPRSLPASRRGLRRQRPSPGSGDSAP